MVAQGTEDVKERPAVFWSPDSSKLVTYRIDSRNAGASRRCNSFPRISCGRKPSTWCIRLPGEVLPKA